MTFTKTYESFAAKVPGGIYTIAHVPESQTPATAMWTPDDGERVRLGDGDDFASLGAAMEACVKHCGERCAAPAEISQ